MLKRETSPFERDRVVADIDGIDELGAVSCTDPDRRAATRQLAQHHMQTARGLGS